MAKRKSINWPGFKHENPIPNASRIGNILMSSIMSGRDPDTAHHAARRRGAGRQHLQAHQGSASKPPAARSTTSSRSISG